MVRLDRLLDAWRADPRADATVELASMLLRANERARGAVPRPFVVQFGDEAERLHGSKVAVLDALARLFAASGEMGRAQALYARVAALAPGDAAVKLEAALREAGLVVPPPEVAARQAIPAAPREAPPRSELPAPRPPASSLAEFAPGTGGARPFPIEGELLEEAAGRAAPPHVPEVPTRELETSGIAAALEDPPRPRRQRAPTVAGLGIPSPPLPGTSAPPPAPLPATPSRPAPQRRSKTLVPDAGAAPPPAALPRAPGVPAFPAPRGPDAAAAVRMFTPVRAFTPPPGNLAWPGATMQQPLHPADEASEGETATDILTPERRRQAIIDNPTTTQESQTRPLFLSPKPAAGGGSSPPTQTRVVPEEAQLRAAAAALAARPSGGDPGPPTPSPRPAARRAAPTRERRRVPDNDDGPATGVTTVDPVASTARAGATMPRPDARREPDEGGPSTARRDTSELLAAALRPRAAGAAPALGAPSPTTSPPAAARAAAPGGGGPAIKPTLLSRGSGGTPLAKPTLLSPGGQGGASPRAPGAASVAGGVAGARAAPSSSPPGRPPIAAEETSHADEVDTKVRPLAPPAPSNSFAPPRPDADDDGPTTNVMPGQPAVRPGPPIVEEPSIEELSADALHTVDEPVSPVRMAEAAARLDPRSVRSTQRLAGTVAPAVVWGPGGTSAAVPDDAAFAEVRTKVLTAEQSAEAGRIDPLPMPASEDPWLITPPPPVAPRFGPPPPSVRPPASFGPPMSSAVPSIAPSFGPVSSAQGGVAAPPGAPRPKGVASPTLLGSIVGVALSLLVAGGAWLYDELANPPRPGAASTDGATELDALVMTGRRADLDRVAARLAEAPPAGAEKARAMTRLRERSIRALELGGVEGLAAAIEDATRLGWSEDEVAFAHVTRAVAERDATAAARLVATWGPRRGTDGWFVLAAAASDELRGDPQAAGRYAEALGLEPRLRPAAIRATRAELLEGNAERGTARIASLAAAGDDAEVAALRALAWLRARRGPGRPAARPGDVPSADALPVELRFVPVAMRLAAGDVPAGERKAAVDEAVARADVPGVAVLFGELALDLRLEASALAIGRAQLAAHPAHAAALRLFATAALDLGKLDLLESEAASLATPQKKLLGAIAAYERGDLVGVAEARAWLGDRDELGREGIVARAERLAGRRRMPEERIQALRRGDVVGGELVAVDALLDAGDLGGARTIADAWGESTSHPLRALRVARLLRYEGKLTEAEAALDGAIPTRPALVERVLLEAESPELRAHARSMLDARFGDERPFYEAYLLALEGDAAAAGKLLESATLPDDDAPLARRIAAALALAASGDAARGRPRVRRLAADWPTHPDVARAARLDADGGAAARPAPRPRPAPRGSAPKNVPKKRR